MKIRALQLGSVCKDKATGIVGTITHILINIDYAAEYVLQPHGINPQDGQPIHRLIVGLRRLTVKKGKIADIDAPTEVLGSKVKDKTSGVAGMAIGLVLFKSGCTHVAVQPSKILSSTRSPVDRVEFPINDCIGKKVPKLSKAELKEDIKKKPSPAGTIPTRSIPSDAFRR